MNSETITFDNKIAQNTQSNGVKSTPAPESNLRKGGFHKHGTNATPELQRKPGKIRPSIRKIGNSTLDN